MAYGVWKALIPMCFYGCAAIVRISSADSCPWIICGSETASLFSRRSLGPICSTVSSPGRILSLTVSRTGRKQETAFSFMYLRSRESHGRCAAEKNSTRLSVKGSGRSLNNLNLNTVCRSGIVPVTDHPHPGLCPYASCTAGTVFRTHTLQPTRPDKTMEGLQNASPSGRSGSSTRSPGPACSENC